MCQRNGLVAEIIICNRTDEIPLAVSVLYGRQKIQPEQLRELDSTEIAILLNEKDFTTSGKRKFKKEDNQLSIS